LEVLVRTNLIPNPAFWPAKYGKNRTLCSVFWGRADLSVNRPGFSDASHQTIYTAVRCLESPGRFRSDPSVSSARINRCEVGFHQPDIQTAAALANTLDVPIAYLYSQDEVMARMILAFDKLTKAQRDECLGIRKTKQPDNGRVIV
jgi:hypothetical protein